MSAFAHGVGRGDGGGVLGEEISPCEPDARRAGGGDGLPGFILGVGGVLAVHLHHERELAVSSVQRRFMPDHADLELVDQQ